jgi:hypothetical protein
VIIVTGPGRSGTSLVASIYNQLGFDPGGPWREPENAGFEESDFVRANERLLCALGTTVAMGRRAPRGRWGLHGARIDALLRPPDEDAARRPPGPLGRLVDWTRYRRLPLDVIDWSKLPRVVDHEGPALLRLCGGASVVKDPRFCWTLPVWLEAGCAVKSVVMCLRDLDAVVDSRSKAFGHMVLEHGRSWAKNDFAYGIGLVMASATAHRVPVVVLRFPDLLDDPSDLYARLPLPEHRSWEEFSAAFEKVRDRGLVHDGR